MFLRYYGLEGHPEDETLESIGEPLGVKKQRVFQIIEKIWEQLVELGLVTSDEALMSRIEAIRRMENLVVEEVELTSRGFDKPPTIEDAVATMRLLTFTSEVIPSEVETVFPNPHGEISLRVVQRLATKIAEVFAIPITELKFVPNDDSVTTPAQVMLTLLRIDFGYQLSQLGKVVTCSNAFMLVKRTTQILETDNDLQSKVAKVRSLYSLAWYQHDYSALAQMQSILHPSQLNEAVKEVEEFEKCCSTLRDEIKKLGLVEQTVNIFLNRYGLGAENKVLSSEELASTFQLSVEEIQTRLKLVWNRLSKFFSEPMSDGIFEKEIAWIETLRRFIQK